MKMKRLIAMVAEPQVTLEEYANRYKQNRKILNEEFLLEHNDDLRKAYIQAVINAYKEEEYQLRNIISSLDYRTLNNIIINNKVDATTFNKLSSVHWKLSDNIYDFVEDGIGNVDTNLDVIPHDDKTYELLTQAKQEYFLELCKKQADKVLNNPPGAIGRPDGRKLWTPSEISIFESYAAYLEFITPNYIYENTGKLLKCWDEYYTKKINDESNIKEAIEDFSAKDKQKFLDISKSYNCNWYYIYSHTDYELISDIRYNIEHYAFLSANKNILDLRDMLQSYGNQTLIGNESLEKTAWMEVIQQKTNPLSIAYNYLIGEK